MAMSQNNIRLPPKWIELNITKRECATFLAIPDDKTVCQCGRRKVDHGDFVKVQQRPESWSPSIHTKVFSTDAYGTILFEGDHHPIKAHYVRLSYDTSPSFMVQLMTYVWNLEMPQLIISIRGGTTNFELPPRIGKIFQTGLMKAAKSTNAWIFTNGLNCGVSKHVGTAFSNERWSGGPKGGKVSIVGITPWGMVENRNELIGRNKDRVYSPLSLGKTKFLHLNPRHYNFLMVDDGSVGKFGGENYLRRRLEKCIATYPNRPNRGCDIPVVVVVLEGGTYTLKQVSDYLYDEPPAPVVIFAGTGRTADLIAWIIKKSPSEQDLESMKDAVYLKLIHLYQITINECPVLYEELKKIYRRKNLVTIYNPNSANTEDDFDSVILSSIFRSQHWAPLQQLSLTLMWDRVDIANNEVFIYGREWSREHLEHAMMEALVSNRLDFVNLLLEHGLNMQSFLTATRLESLYSLEKIPSRLLRALLIEFSKLNTSKHRRMSNLNHDRNLTLHDVGIALSHMMGHVFKSRYIQMVARTQGSQGSTNNDDEKDLNSQIFPQPFDDLFLWAVLTKRHEMSKLLWPHGHGALAKALIAVKLNKYFANEISSTEPALANAAADFENYAEEWENLSFSLLDACYRSDSKMARQLLTSESSSTQTCLTLAVMANHELLLGHSCCQSLLADLWMGALNIKSNSSLKIVLGVLFPPLIFCLEYKSKEELKLLPQQERNPAYQTSQGGNAEGDTLVDGEEYGKLRDNTSIKTYDANKSRESINAFLKNREMPGRKTDLAEVVNKLGFAKNNVQQTSSETEPTAERSIHNLKRDLSFRVKVKSHRHKHSSFVTTQQSLGAWSKFVEFQKAPVTNFCRHTIAYLVFTGALAYIILYPQNRKSPGWLEMYVIACIATQGLECIREFLQIDAISCSQKIVQAKEKIWQIADFLMVIFFLTGTALRLSESYFDNGMLIYRTSSIYWNMRLYKYLGVHRFVGPKIVMMSRMFSHMAYFAMIILVVIISFGMAREAIKAPYDNPTWKDLSEAFLEPYVMMFGEVDLKSINPQCGSTGGSINLNEEEDCPLGYWLIPCIWVVYMLVSNILIVNVLIAVFNGIYAEIDAVAVQVWMFQRFTFVMEFEEKPLLPPPFIIISHTIAVIRYFYKQFISCMCEDDLIEQKLDDDEKPHFIMGNDHSPKCFLNTTEQHMVFDFEEDNLELIRNTLYKEQKGPPVAGGTDSLLANRTGISFEKASTQQLKSSLHCLYNEMEAQRTKLDKLITYWEMDMMEHQSEQHYDTRIAANLGVEHIIIDNPKTTPVSRVQQKQKQ